jgi:hypothetical protein
MPEEPTLIEETPAPEAAEQKPPEEVVPREQYVNLQRQLSRRDRELQEIRSKAVTPEHLKALEDKFFSAIELMAPEDEEVVPVSRRERLRQLRETKPAAPTPQESPEIQYFNRRLKEEGYELSDSVVREVVSNLTEDDTPDVAIKRIKSEKEKRAKSDDDRIQQAIEAGVMAKLKELGVLKEDGQPSASATDRAELKRLYIENPNNPRAAEWEAIRDQR